MHNRIVSRALALIAAVAVSSVLATAVEDVPGGVRQAPAAGAGQAQPAGGGGGGRGGGGGFGPPTTQTRYDDYTGFTKIWDGATFTNWDGERDVWSIVDGTLHADTTKTPGQHHIHYKGPDPVLRDFTLKVEVKLSAAGANGGIQYRSRLAHPTHGGSIQDPLGKSLPPNITTLREAIAAGLVAAPAPRGAGPGGARGGGGGPAAPAAPNPCVGEVGNLNPGPPPAGRGNPAPGALPGGNPWQVNGYQFDLDSDNQYTGQLYEGGGRSIITAPGTIGMLLPGRCKILLGKLPGDAKAAIKPHRGLDGEWQQIEVIVRGNTMIHMLNGQVMSVTVDDDPVARLPQGILSLQLEGSGQIWYRNVYLKRSEASLEFPK